MLYNKSARNLNALKEVLQQEQAELSVNKTLAIQQQQWEYAAEIQCIENQLEEFIKSCFSLPSTIVSSFTPITYDL